MSLKNLHISEDTLYIGYAWFILGKAAPTSWKGLINEPHLMTLLILNGGYVRAREVCGGWFS